MALQIRVSKGGFFAGATPFIAIAALSWFAPVSLYGAIVTTALCLPAALIVGLVVGSEVAQWNES